MQIDLALEASLLKVMSIRHNFEQFLESVDKKRLLQNTQLLLKDYELYFKKHKKHDEIDWGIFYTHFSQEWHASNLDEEDIKYYKDYVFPAITKTNSEQVTECLLALVDRSYKDKIKDSLVSGVDTEMLNKIAHEYEATKGCILGDTVIEESEGYTVDTLDFSVLDKKSGIPYFLPSLQDSLGSLTVGQFVAVAADSNTGKSAFVISQLVHAFKFVHRNNINKPILYFNSESTCEEVMNRFFSNMYRKHYVDGFEEICEHQEQVVSRFKEDFKDNSSNLWLFPMSTIDTFQKIKQKVEKLKPALVIIDIVDKLAPEEDPKSLKKLYDDLRVLSADYCPILGTSQAGSQEYFDKETGQLKTRKWLTDKAMYGSKSGKQGASETLIMIGKDEMDPNVRFVSVTKNKRGKPVKVTCTLEAKYSRYNEMAW